MLDKLASKLLGEKYPIVTDNGFLIKNRKDFEMYMSYRVGVSEENPQGLWTAHSEQIYTESNIGLVKAVWLVVTKRDDIDYQARADARHLEEIK